MCQTLFGVLYKWQQHRLCYWWRNPKHGKDRNLTPDHTARSGRAGTEPKTPWVHAPHHSCYLLARALKCNNQPTKTKQTQNLSALSAHFSPSFFIRPTSLWFLSKHKWNVHCCLWARLRGWHKNQEGLAFTLRVWLVCNSPGRRRCTNTSISTWASLVMAESWHSLLRKESQTMTSSGRIQGIVFSL